jgi:hypothetical protein
MAPTSGQSEATYFGIRCGIGNRGNAALRSVIGVVTLPQNKRFQGHFRCLATGLRRWFQNERLMANWRCVEPDDRLWRDVEARERPRPGYNLGRSGLA